MVVNRVIPWHRKSMPIQRVEELDLMPSAWRDFERSFRDVDRLFDRFLTVMPHNGVTSAGSDYLPLVDIQETDKEFCINVEVPGMDEKDIDISMSRDMLTISGEKKEEKEENLKGVHRMERRYGSFSRSIPLPENGVDTDKVEASYHNGVLRIKLPKAAEYQESPRKIPVTSSNKK